MRDSQEQGISKPKAESEDEHEHGFKLIAALTSPQGTLVLLVVAILLGGFLNYYGSNPRILYLPLLGICVLLFFVGHSYIRSEIRRRTAIASEKPRPQEKNESAEIIPTPQVEPTASLQAVPRPKRFNSPPKTVTSPLTSFSDGQRYVLKKKLEAYAGDTVRIILIGHDPQQNIVFEQLIDIFKDSGWKLQTWQIGMVGTVGVNFPSGPYLTGPDIAEPIVGQVFSVFSAVGIDLPLTPNAFMGNGAAADVVIVLH